MLKHLMMLGAMFLSFPTSALADEATIDRLVHSPEAAGMSDLGQLSSENQDSIACMALAIYYESKSEPRQGQRAVGYAIQNRVESPKYPDQACEVVFQKWRGRPQFVFVNRRNIIPSNSGQWKNALEVAYNVHTGSVGNPIGNATSFYNPAISKKRVSGVRIGHHVFHK